MELPRNSSVRSPCVFPAILCSAGQDPERLLLVEVEDKGVILDMDTETDYRKAVALYQARAEAKG